MPSATVAATEIYSAMPSNRLKRDSTDVLVDASTPTADESDSVKRPRLVDSDPFGHNMFKAYVKTTLDEAEKVWLSLSYPALFRARRHYRAVSLTYFSSITPSKSIL
jgi:hypothetical protein